MLGSFYRQATACTLWLLLGLPLFALPPALAQESTNAGPDTSLQSLPGMEADEQLRDPEALAELKRATDFLTGLPRFQFAATIAYDVVQSDGRRLQFEKTGEVFLQRPDRLFAKVFLDDGRQRQFWYDGKTLSFAELPKNIHARVQSPATIDGMLDMLEELVKDPMPLADLLYSDLNPLEQRAEEADFVDNSLIDGRPCSHLAFRGETVDWQLWVEQGERPFIRKVAISYREQPGVPQFVAWLNEWQTPERFDDKLFIFSPPEGSLPIDVLMPKPLETRTGGQP